MRKFQVHDEGIDGPLRWGFEEVPKTLPKNTPESRYILDIQYTRVRIASHVGQAESPGVLGTVWPHKHITRGV